MADVDVSIHFTRNPGLKSQNHIDYGAVFVGIHSAVSLWISGGACSSTFPTCYSRGETQSVTNV